MSDSWRSQEILSRFDAPGQSGGPSSAKAPPAAEGQPAGHPDWYSNVNEAKLPSTEDFVIPVVEVMAKLDGVGGDHKPASSTVKKPMAKEEKWVLVGFSALFSTAAAVVSVILCIGIVASVVIALLGQSSVSPNHTLTANTKWSLLAWGFPDGGKDTVDGTSMVLVDIDSTDTITKYAESGYVVICYLSAGSTEQWRDDYKNRQAEWDSLTVGKMDNFDEKWLDITRLSELKALYAPRFDEAAERGCHGIEADNINCHSNSDCSTSIPGSHSAAELKAAQIAYCEWQLGYIHSKGMLAGMKNAMDLLNESTLGTQYDFHVNESCHQYDECHLLSTFTDQNKLIAQVEYSLPADPSDYCSDDTSNSVTTRMMTKYCDGSSGLCSSSSSWTNCF